MASKRFTRGDWVHHRPTGESMVVEEVYSPFFTSRYLCSWMDEEGNAQLDVFRVDEIEHFAQYLMVEAGLI